MSKNLVEKGNLSSPLILYNRTSKRAEELSARLEKGKTKVVYSVEEAVSGADIIFICLGADPSVKETFNTATKGDVKGKLFVDCSTVHPDTTDELEKIATSNGADFVACPGRCKRQIFWPYGS